MVGLKHLEYMSEELASDNASVAELKEEVGADSGLDVNSLFAEADTPVSEPENEVSETSEIQEETTEEESEEQEVSESGEGEKKETKEDVLSKRGAKHAQQTINKLTRLLKEQREDYDARIQKLEGEVNKSSNEKASIETRIANALDTDELDDLFDQADEAIDHAEDALRDGDYGDYSEEQLKSIKANSRSAKRLIKAKKKEIAKLNGEKQQWNQKAMETFDFLKDPSSDEYIQVDAWLRNAEFNNAFKGNPKGIYFASLAALGIKQLKSKESNESVIEEPEQAPKPKKKPPKAPRLPGNDTSATSAPGGRFEQSKPNEAKLPDRNLDESDLTNFFLQVDQNIRNRK